MNTTGPYRQNSKVNTVKKLPRRLAWFRGVWRRVIAPIQFVAFVAGIGVLVNGCIHMMSKADVDFAEQAAKRHYADWQKAIDENQAKLDVRQAEVNRKEMELNARVKSFEDVVSMMPLLAKSGDATPLVEALKKNQH